MSTIAITKLNSFVLLDRSAVKSAIKQIGARIKISGAQWNVESVNQILSERLRLSQWFICYLSVSAKSGCSRQNKSSKPALQQLQDDVREAVIYPIFEDEEIRPDENIRIFINPDGRFIKGGLAVQKFFMIINQHSCGSRHFAHSHN